MLLVAFLLVNAPNCHLSLVLAAVVQGDAVNCNSDMSNVTPRYLGSEQKDRVSAIRERHVQRYSEVFGLGAEGQGFVVDVDFQLTFGFLVAEMEDCRHRFGSGEL